MIWLKFYAIVLFQMVVIHGDLVKDILFIYVYGRIIETNKKIEIQSLPVQFLLLMAVSIALPILANCILVMPEVSKYGLKSWKALLISTLISPFSPAICLYIRARMATQQHIQCLRFWIKKDRENSEIDEPEVRKHPLMTSPKRVRVSLFVTQIHKAYVRKRGNGGRKKQNVCDVIHEPLYSQPP